MKCRLSPSQINETLMNGLGGALREARGRWRRLSRKELRAKFQELQARREHLIRQEDLYPPNDPLRLSFQCCQAVVDLHIVELKRVAAAKGLSRLPG